MEIEHMVIIVSLGIFLLCHYLSHLVDKLINNHIDNIDTLEDEFIEDTLKRINRLNKLSDILFLAGCIILILGGILFFTLCQV